MQRIMYASQIIYLLMIYKLGETTLHFSVTNTSAPVFLSILIKEGADIHAQRADGTPVIMIATPDAAAGMNNFRFFRF
jgi:hypothetical protein